MLVSLLFLKALCSEILVNLNLVFTYWSIRRSGGVCGKVRVILIRLEFLGTALHHDVKLISVLLILVRHVFRRNLTMGGSDLAREIINYNFLRV